VIFAKRSQASRRRAAVISTGIGTLSLVFALALAGTARAQDTNGGLRPTDGAPATPDPAPPPAPPAPAVPATPDTPPQVESAPKPPADPGNWKGGPAPAAPAGGAAGADPLAAPATPQAPPKDPNTIDNDDPRAGKIIDRNYSDAIKIYDNVLKNDGESVENLDHRIESNEKLVANYKKKLTDCNDQKRRMQIELFNRTFYLKQQRDKGAIPDDVYERLIKQEEKKYADRSAQTTSDIQFYEKEIQDAEGRLSTLRAERRVQVTTFKSNQIAKGPNGKKPPMKASQRTILSLQERLQKLSAFETKNPMDSGPVCDECLRPQGPGPMAPPPGNPQGPSDPSLAQSQGGGGS
jgi:hypothetical protein